MLNLLRKVTDAGRRMKAHCRVGHRVDVREHVAALPLPVVDELLFRLRASGRAEGRESEGEDQMCACERDGCWRIPEQKRGVLPQRTRRTAEEGLKFTNHNTIISRITSRYGELWVVTNPCVLRVLCG